MHTFHGGNGRTSRHRAEPIRRHPRKVRKTHQSGAAKRDQVVAVVRAIAQASRDFSADPQRWADVVAGVRTEVPRSALAALAKSFEGDWSVDGGLSAGELIATEDWLFSGADFAGLHKPPLAEWADLSIEHDAVEALDPASLEPVKP